MILITAAAEVQGDLRSEFGPIPPVFLPIGNRPLLYWQVQTLRQAFGDESIVLSLPENISLTNLQSRAIDDSGVEVVTVPAGFSLAASVLFALNVSESRDDIVRILHGDTLLKRIDSSVNVVGVSATTDSYDWQLAGTQSGEPSNVWCGYFCFESRRELSRALALSDDDFEGAVLAYSQRIPLEEIEAVGWLDLGHVNTYFQAREKFTTQREFNDLEIFGGIVRKSSHKTDKILAEAKWFDLLPEDLRLFAPALYGVDHNVGSYSLEYLPMTPLNDLFVHGNHPKHFWAELFRSIGDWLLRAQMALPANESLAVEARNRLVVAKTRARVETFLSVMGVSGNEPVVFNGVSLPAVWEIVDDLIADSLSRPVLPGLLHGDMCFSNILYDSRNRRVRLLDPRGIPATSSDATGDLHYDLAKLSHSVIGFYDLIISGAFDVSWDLSRMKFDLEVLTTHNQQEVKDVYLRDGYALLGDIDLNASIPQMILLFFSMLPLHADNQRRQWGLFANGLRLYHDYKEGLI
ncbi:hypothetical protein HMPREF2785_01010 [Corynebacterium sp. HMSC067D03]|uniref:hypothetical protein n=1 Tax=unclassified Corynebacterium TaxID=2624378 RepID=UPI0008A3A7F7|nr:MULTISPECIES: hypothetical protein [unclassified Corynebacterium]OFL18276.1 hypothetical protein HMPREF2785_01010 [Corynebacterium sp. HMSC067D03]OFO34319.1 hypothetical protein HMPREF3048_02450 [Corynebacterium sp. HMSC075D04]